MFASRWRKVLQCMEQMQVPKPFALREQYKAAWTEKAQESEPSTKKRKTTTEKKNKNKQAPSSCSKADTAGVGSYTPQVYGSMRLEFVNKLKEEGMSHRDACDRWHSSEQKKHLLKDLSVSELIRRRFVPKGTTSNPFAS